MIHPRSKALWIVIVALSLVFPIVVYGGINCSGKLNQAEIIICHNVGLKVLDRIVNKMYHSVLSTSDGYSTLMQNQKKWLRKDRNRCRKASCLFEAYKKRILWLHSIIIDNSSILVEHKYNVDVEETCLELVELFNQNALTSFRVSPGGANSPETISEDEVFQVRKGYTLNLAGKVYYLKIGNKEKPMRFAFFYSGGTCPTTEIYNLDIFLETEGRDTGKGKIKDDIFNLMDERDARWFTSWDVSEVLILYNGNYYVVTTSGNMLIISRIDTDGIIQQIRIFYPHQQKRTIKSYKSLDLCSSILKERIKPIPWVDVTKELPVSGLSDQSKEYYKEFVMRYGAEAQSVGTIKIDLNGNGSLEVIGKFEYSSGAGCGSSYVWLRELTNKLDGIKRGDLNDKLGIFNSSDIDIYEFTGKYYIFVHGGYGLDGDLFNISGDKICVFGTRIEAE